MPVSLTCGECETKLSAPVTAGGKRVKCPNCGSPVWVPQPDHDEDDELPTPRRGVRGRKYQPASGGNGGLILGLAVGAVAVAAVGFAVYWFGIRTPQSAKGPNPPGQPVPSPNGQSPAPKPPVILLPVPPIPKPPGPIFGPIGGKPIPTVVKVVPTDLNRYGLAVTADLPEATKFTTLPNVRGRLQVIADYGGLNTIVFETKLEKDEWIRSSCEVFLKGYTTLAEDDSSHYCEQGISRPGTETHKYAIYRKITTPNDPVGIRFLDPVGQHTRKQADEIHGWIQSAKANDKPVTPPKGK